MNRRATWVSVGTACVLTACLGCGGSSSGNKGLGTAPEESYYAYVTENGTGNLLTYSEASGKLTAVGNPIGGNLNGCGLTVSPNNQFLYAVTCETGWIQPYSINSSTGKLTAVGSGISVDVPGPSNGYLTPLVISRNGKFAYIVNEGSLQQSVVVYSIGSDGSLSMAGSPVNLNSGGAIHMSIAMAPVGNYLYVAYWGTGEVYAFSVDTNSGALTAVSGSPFEINNGTIGGTPSYDPQALAVPLSGNFVYAPDQTGSISMFSVAAGTGVLTAMPYYYLPNSPGRDGGQMVFNPSETKAYVQCKGSGWIAAYSVDTTTGALTQTGLTMGTDSMGNGIALDPTGSYLFAAWNEGPTSVGGEVSIYSIDSSTGAVTYTGSAPGTSGTKPTAIAFATE